MTDDLRRQKPIKIKWDGMIGQLTIDGESWGAIEWSEKRGAWCIEDAEGACLRHKASIHGQAAAKDAAIELAEAMIRDGRMPSPEEAKQQHKSRQQRDRERRAKYPSEIRRRQQREEQERLFRASMDAGYQQRREEREEPFYAAVADTLNLDDPELWKSNSFARLRARLIVIVRAAIADMEYDLVHHLAGPRRRHSQKYQQHIEKRLARAREILERLDSPRRISND
jgi:hypothetical protein